MFDDSFGDFIAGSELLIAKTDDVNSFHFNLIRIIIQTHPLMKRTEFLRGVGLAGLSSLIPFNNSLATPAGSTQKTTGTCVLIPSETEGPFPLDLSTSNSATYFRSDVRESCTGTRLNLKMKIIGIDSCQALPNVRVNIWHCDKDGIYSGYNNSQNPGSTTTTYLRGYQMTDVNGEVNFTTIFPGWYNGRICHIHFQVYVSSVYKAVSQLTFDIPTKNALYAANSLYTKGADPLNFSGDNIFSDGYTQQLATLTANSDGSYNSYLEVTINSNGAPSGIRNYEGETGGQFKLGQNFPNPHNGRTTVPYSLITSSDVQLDIYDLSARLVRSLPQGTKNAGDQKVVVDFAELGIASGNYLYQLQVSNSSGIFRQAKMMSFR